MTNTRSGLLFICCCMPLTGQTPATDADLLALACNQFAKDLHGQLAAGQQPTSSPGSVAIALLMLLPGARGETANEIATMLHLPPDLRDGRLQAAAADLLAQTGILESGKKRRTDENDAQLRLTNDVWVQTGYSLVPAYVDVLRRSFGADHHDTDFARDTEKARITINKHIGKATRGRITELLQPGLLDVETRVVLTNALWFKGAWADAFDKASTADRPFALADGSSVQVPTMLETKPAMFAESDAWTWLALGFEGSEIRFEAVVPKAGKDLGDAEAALFSDTQHRTLQQEQVAIDLPRFRVSGAHDLKGPLHALGMRLAFAGGRADFSGMTTKNDLFVDEVVHQTWIDVDEAGAEAAAATAVVMKWAAAPVDGGPKVFRADRPFAFALRHRASGLLLFVGRVNDPRGKQS